MHRPRYTNTITPTPSPLVGTLDIRVAADSFIPTTNATVWYSISTTFDGTQPFPPGQTWTQLGSSQTLPFCPSNILFGTITVPVGSLVYVQIRDTSGLNIYLTTNNFTSSNPCLFPSLTTPYTDGFSMGSPSAAGKTYKISSPITTAPAP